MEVYKLLHETKYLPINAEFHPESKIGACGEVYGEANIQCPKCEGNRFFKGYDYSEKFLSCANKKCMTENKNATLEMERELRRTQNTEQNQINTYAKRMRLPQRFQHASMSKIKYDDDIMKKLNGWINNPKNFLFISGSPGTGKTYLTAAILNYFGTQFKDVYYMNMRILLKRLTDAIQEGQSTYHKIEDMIDHDLIILDDLGASALTEWQKEIIHYFIDQLYENEIPAIVTTNFTDNEMCEKIHHRVLDRLYAAENTTIYLDNISYRAMRF